VAQRLQEGAQQRAAGTRLADTHGEHKAAVGRHAGLGQAQHDGPVPAASERDDVDRPLRVERGAQRRRVAS